MKRRLLLCGICFLLFGGAGYGSSARISPVVTTQPVGDDSDDPAIWVHPGDPAKSLVLGTDKGGKLFAFNLDGQIVAKREGMVRLNNVDVEYGVLLGGQAVDIAIATDRGADRIYIWKMPELTSLDGGQGIPVFEGSSHRLPMGIGIYKRPSDGQTFVILSRKSGPVEGYLWQYQLIDKEDRFGIEKVRAFGKWSGQAEIEAIAVDDELGYVYYSDEVFGVRKYQADPDAKDANREVVVFGKSEFAEDREGISIFNQGNGSGYILVSDQQADVFQVFDRRDGHRHLGSVMLSTQSSDGSEVVSVGVGSRFPKGLFVAMSDDRTFQFYDWRDILQILE